MVLLVALHLKKEQQGNISFKVSLVTNLYSYTSIYSSKQMDKVN